MAEKKRTLWVIENYDEATRRKVKAFAASQAITVPEALKIIVAEWEAQK